MISSLSATGQCCTGNLYSISQVATDDPSVWGKRADHQPFVSGNIRMHCIIVFTEYMIYMDVSENSGTPKSSILIGFSIINHPFWGTNIFGNIHIGVSQNGGFTQQPFGFLTKKNTFWGVKWGVPPFKDTPIYPPGN